MRAMTTKRLLICAGAVGVLSALPVSAQLDWVGTAGPLFFDTPTNWNPAEAPNSDVSVTFSIDVGPNNPIIVGASSGANQMDFFSHNWEFTGAASGTLNGGDVIINDALATTLANGANVTASNNLNWDTGGNTIIGDTGFGSLTVQDASDYSAYQFFIGNTATGVGQLNLIGAGTTVTAYLNSNTGLFTIGRRGGTGTVNVIGGAQMLTASNSGNDIWVGGYLDDDDGPGVITSTGTLNVSGAGSFVETEDMIVGIFGGNGFLNVTNGGNVTLSDGTSPDLYFGGNRGFGDALAHGYGLVDGDNSLINARSILIGDNGVGELIVSSGGEARTRIDGVTPSDIYIGNVLGSSGKAAVYGLATNGTTRSRMFSEDSLYVGNAGLGELNIGLDLNDNPVGSGELQVDSDLYIGTVLGNALANKVVVSGPNASASIGAVLRAGHAGKGSFEALDGASITVGTTLVAGGLPGGDGSILIDGAGTTLTARDAFIGNANNTSASLGVVTVSNQAVVTFNGTSGPAVTLGDDNLASGTFNVIGAGTMVSSTGSATEWWIGGSSNEDGGVGVLNVMDGAAVSSAGRVVLGYRGNASGQVHVDGPGSHLDVAADYTLIGYGGLGTVTLTNGGVLNADNIFVADNSGSAGSQLDIDGPGSAVNLQGLMNIGDTVRGVTNVTNGGSLKVAMGGPGDRLIIGDEAAADGSKLRIDGAGSRVDYFGTADVAVGNAGGANTANLSDRATLEVTAGGVFSAVQRDGSNNIVSQAGIIVGDVSGGNGYIKVDGPGSRVEASVLYVGDGDSSSSGIVDLTNGGVIDLTAELQAGSNGSGVGTVTVSGPGSKLLVGTNFSLGDDLPGNGSATGNFMLTQGGYASTAGQAYIGHYTGSFGTATLDSSTPDKSVWDIGGELTLAGTETSSQASGSGTLNVNTGGVVNIASNLRIRNLGDVNLSGGEINIGGDLLLVDAGSAINFAFCKLGFTDPSGTTLSPNMLERILTLGGGNRPTLYGNMELAIAGTANIGGPLRISGGTLSAGALTPGSWTQLDFDNGTLNLTGSDLTVGVAGPLGKDLTLVSGQTLNVSQTLAVQSGATLTVVGGLSAGTLANSGGLTFVDAQAGDKHVDATINMLAGGQLTVVGDVQFDGQLNGLTHVFGPGRTIVGGDFAPGNSPAVVSFDGGFGVASTGTVQIELGGATPGSQHDQLVVAGDAQLGGTLELVLINGYTPTLGSTFTVLTSAGLNGTSFDTILGDALGGGLALQVSYTSTDVIVTAVTALAGDTDLDGDIDDSDLGTSFANYTGPVGAAGGKSLAQGDTDGDGDVDDSDLGTSFSGYTGPLGPTNVPEPASLVILAGLLGLTARRRR